VTPRAITGTVKDFFLDGKIVWRPHLQDADKSECKRLFLRLLFALYRPPAVRFNGMFDGIGERQTEQAV